MASRRLKAHAYLAGAFLVLVGARMLVRLRLIEPGGLGTALFWSNSLARRGMAAWRRDRW